MGRLLSRITWIEGAIAFALVGTLLAISVPAVVANVHFSRLTEATEGVVRLSTLATAYAGDRPASQAFPRSAPLTPAAPPRGVKEIDPVGAWDHPTWAALGFRASAEGVPHAFAFAFDSDLGGDESRFVARARGDLDGDGQPSLFEARGFVKGGHAGVEPGLYVESELE